MNQCEDCKKKGTTLYHCNCGMWVCPTCYAYRHDYGMVSHGPTLREAVAPKQPCPSCGGKGYVWNEFSLQDEPCDECDGQV